MHATNGGRPCFRVISALFSVELTNPDDIKKIFLFFHFQSTLLHFLHRLCSNPPPTLLQRPRPQFLLHSLDLHRWHRHLTIPWRLSMWLPRRRSNLSPDNTKTVRAAKESMAMTASMDKISMVMLLISTMLISMTITIATMTTTRYRFR